MITSGRSGPAAAHTSQKGEKLFRTGSAWAKVKVGVGVGQSWHHSGWTAGL